MSGSEPIPVYDVAFKRRLEDIPNYYVSLLDSLFEVTFVDVSQRVSKDSNTVLAVAVSDFYSLPDDSDQSPADDLATASGNNVAADGCCAATRGIKRQGNSPGVASR